MLEKALETLEKLAGEIEASLEDLLREIAGTEEEEDPA